MKLTVNYDDPNTYHLYYGDESGQPGTILTFFPWPDSPRGRLGTGQATATSFSIPTGAVEFWTERLKRDGIDVHGPVARFNDQVLSFADPDGLRLELVAQRDADNSRVWKKGPVPEKYAIRGFRGVTLSEQTSGPTIALLSDVLGFGKVAEDAGLSRYESPLGKPGSILDVIGLPEIPRGVVRAGSVHHIAWRTRSDEAQKSWREVLTGTGLQVTPVIDRKYFHSIYFREPGGVLFEIATDPPGFAVDESLSELGTRLMLPPWLEATRSEVEQALPRIQLPNVNSVR